MSEEHRPRSEAATAANRLRLARMTDAERYETTAACRAGLHRWYADLVDPNRTLTADELDAQIRAVRRERMRTLAYRSHEARRRNAAARTSA